MGKGFGRLFADSGIESDAAESYVEIAEPPRGPHRRPQLVPGQRVSTALETPVRSPCPRCTSGRPTTSPSGRWPAEATAGLRRRARTASRCFEGVNHWIPDVAQSTGSTASARSPGPSERHTAARPLTGRPGHDPDRPSGSATLAPLLAWPVPRHGDPAVPPMPVRHHRWPRPGSVHGGTPSPDRLHCARPRRRTSPRCCRPDATPAGPFGRDRGTGALAGWPPTLPAALARRRAPLGVIGSARGGGSAMAAPRLRAALPNDGCSSGGYHLPSLAIHQPGPSDLSLIEFLHYYAC